MLPELHDVISPLDGVVRLSHWISKQIKHLRILLHMYSDALVYKLIWKGGTVIGTETSWSSTQY